MKQRSTTRGVTARLLVVVASLALATIPAQAQAPDLDGDGIPNIVDPDVDNDGIPNALDRNVDGGIAKSGPFRGQYIGDHFDNNHPAEHDIDGDSLADDSLGETDIDGDSLSDRDVLEDDTDGDGRKNGDPSEQDTDGDGRRDSDDDEDDIDGDGDDNRDDEDDDNDGDPDEDDPDHHPEDDEVEVEQALTATPAAPPGSRARVQIQRLATGKIEFEVRARDLEAGDYEIVIDGISRGILALVDDGGETEGEVEFETNPNKQEELPLDFDVIGLPINLVRDGVTYFTGIVPTPPDAPSGETEHEDPSVGEGVTVVLQRAGFVSPEASAELEVEFGILGAISVEVQVENLPVGDYALSIGGEVRATLVVMLDGGDLRGKVRFDAEANDPDELPLEFAVAGEAVTISQGGTVFFSGVAPANPPGN